MQYHCIELTVANSSASIPHLGTPSLGAKAIDSFLVLRSCTSYSQHTVHHSKSNQLINQLEITISRTYPYSGDQECIHITKPSKDRTDPFSTGSTFVKCLLRFQDMPLYQAPKQTKRSKTLLKKCNLGSRNMNGCLRLIFKHLQKPHQFICWLICKV